METTMDEVISSISYPFIAAVGVIVVPLMFFLTPKDKKSDEDKHGLYPNKKNAVITAVFFIIATALFAKFVH